MTWVIIGNKEKHGQHQGLGLVILLAKNMALRQKNIGNRIAIHQSLRLEERVKTLVLFGG